MTVINAPRLGMNGLMIQKVAKRKKQQHIMRSKWLEKRSIRIPMIIEAMTQEADPDEIAQPISSVVISILSQRSGIVRLTRFICIL